MSFLVSVELVAGLRGEDVEEGVAVAAEAFSGESVEEDTALAIDKPDAVGAGNDVEEWVFSTVDLDKCKVETMALLKLIVGEVATKPGLTAQAGLML